MKQIFKFYVEISYVFIDTTLRIWYVGKEKQGFNSLIGVYVYNLVSKSRLMPNQTNKQKKKKNQIRTLREHLNKWGKRVK